jgi:hypothetical protein
LLIDDGAGTGRTQALSDIDYIDSRADPRLL